MCATHLGAMADALSKAADEVLHDPSTPTLVKLHKCRNSYEAAKSALRDATQRIGYAEYLAAYLDERLK
jgi:hypothetical protein